MKKWIAVLAAVALAIALGYFLSRTRPVPPAASPAVVAQDSTTPNTTAQPNANPRAAESNVTQPPSAAAAPALYPYRLPNQPPPLQFTAVPPAIVLEHLSRAVRQYGQMFGGNPVGTNPEITRQLAGQNPRHINFLDPAAGMRIDANGNLVDPWGTPYFFHQISGTDMEIHSAGPDGIMWTADDLVSH